MAAIEGRPKIELQVTIALTEAEARALDGLVGYGDDAFVKAFYESLGQHYLKPHEAGLRSLFRSVRAQLPCVLDRVNAARKAFEETK
jgi:hypothetical protein